MKPILAGMIAAPVIGMSVLYVLFLIAQYIAHSPVGDIIVEYRRFIPSIVFFMLAGAFCGAIWGISKK